MFLAAATDDVGDDVIDDVINVRGAVDDVTDVGSAGAGTGICATAATTGGGAAAADDDDVCDDVIDGVASC